jgi:hypothetical protein
VAAPPPHGLELGDEASAEQALALHGLGENPPSLSAASGQQEQS